MHVSAGFPYIAVTVKPNYQEITRSVAGTKQLLTAKVLCCSAGRMSSHWALIFFFIVPTVWSRIIVMHWKQGSMTGRDRHRRHPIYAVVYWQSYCHLSNPERDKPTLSFDQWLFSSLCLSQHLLLTFCLCLSIFLS